MKEFCVVTTEQARTSGVYRVILYSNIPGHRITERITEPNLFDGDQSLILKDSSYPIGINSCSRLVIYQKINI